MCADLARSFGARSLVFGAPKNRELNGLTPQQGFEIAREFFREVAPDYEQRGVCLCLEANPSEYGCQFVTDSAAAAKLVRAVDRPGFGLHLDTACMHLAGEDIPQAIRNGFDVLQHFHVSEPFLGSFADPVVDHAGAAETLRALGYSAWVSLEMRESPSPAEDVSTAVRFLAENYGEER